MSVLILKMRFPLFCRVITVLWWHHVQNLSVYATVFWFLLFYAAATHRPMKKQRETFIQSRCSLEKIASWLNIPCLFCAFRGSRFLSKLRHCSNFTLAPWLNLTLQIIWFDITTRSTATRFLRQFFLHWSSYNMQYVVFCSSIIQHGQKEIFETRNKPA